VGWIIEIGNKVSLDENNFIANTLRTLLQLLPAKHAEVQKGEEETAFEVDQSPQKNNTNMRQLQACIIHACSIAFGLL